MLKVNTNHTILGFMLFVFAYLTKRKVSQSFFFQHDVKIFNSFKLKQSAEGPEVYSQHGSPYLVNVDRFLEIPVVTIKVALKTVLLKNILRPKYIN